MFNKPQLMRDRVDQPAGQRGATQKQRSVLPNALRWVIPGLFLGLVITLVSLGAPQQTYAVSDKLPDLGMAKFKHLSIETLSGGVRRLRFGARIVNIGQGAFEVRGSRPNTSISTMTVIQRIYNTAGGFRDIPTGAVMYYAGDGHNHWHVRNLQTYELIRLDNGSTLVSGKLGFCFLDSFSYNLSLPGAPSNPVYTKTATPKVCAKGDPSALQAIMGLSVGWGDYYGPKLPDQYIDITGVPAGTYRLKGTADKQNWFLEMNENNNCTWTDIQIDGSGTTLTILKTSGDSVPCS